MKKEDIVWEDLNRYKDTLQLEGEVWKSVMYNYEISTYGRCKGFVKGVWKILRIGDNGAGYKTIGVFQDGKHQRRYLHRLVAEVFLPNPKNLPQVNHKKTGLGKFDNRVEHLEWCTASYNIRDAHKNGNMVNRTVHNTSLDKKSDEFVKEMYRYYKKCGKITQTAVKFGVPRTTLSSIVNKRSRRKITDEVDKQLEK